MTGLKKPYKPQKGAVTFLDVLGWKGIYEKHKHAIEYLTKLIEDIKQLDFRYTEEISNTYNEMRGNNSVVLSISDTIAIFTPGDPEPTISLHAKLCKYIIPQSIDLNIPIRGAISYGKYSVYDNIMVGPAVDEAASWHESTDWIGVSLSPSAQFSIKDKNILDIKKYDNIPYKKSTKGLNMCVNWDDGSIDDLYSKFIEMGPHTPEIANKYLNTLSFINWKKDED